MKAADIVSNTQRLESERKNLDQVWEFIERYVAPFQGQFFRDIKNETEVNWRKRNIYDSTAVDANLTLASSMQGNLTPSHMQWYNLRWRQDSLNKDRETKAWLEEAGKTMFHGLQDSNFDLEAGEVYQALCSFAQAPIVEEFDPDTKELMFTAVPPKESYFELNWKGTVERFYRKRSYTALQIFTKWGDSTPKIIQDVLKATPERTYTVIFCIYVRDKYRDIDISIPLQPQFRPIGFKYVLQDSKEELGKEGGYYEMPVFIPRWRRNVDSKNGFSPAMVCLSDILTLNEWIETDLEARGKAIEPATLVTQRGLLSNLDLQRGGLTVVRELNDIKPFESGSKFDVSTETIVRLQAQIRRAFFVDQLELKESPAMTATEVNVRYELMQRLLGPTLGRLTNDFLNPLLQRTFNIMFREQMFGDIPQKVAELGGTLDIEYIGPLPKAQRSGQAESIIRWLSDVAQLAQLFPDVADLPDVDTAIRELGDLRGVPAKAINSETKVKQTRTARRQQEEAARKLAEAEAAGKAGEAVGKGAMAVSEAGIDPTNMGSMNV